MLLTNSKFNSSWNIYSSGSLASCSACLFSTHWYSDIRGWASSFLPLFCRFFSGKGLAHSPSLMRLGGVGLTTCIFIDVKNQCTELACILSRATAEPDYDVSYQVCLIYPQGQDWEVAEHIADRKREASRYLWNMWHILYHIFMWTITFIPHNGLRKIGSLFLLHKEESKVKI